MSKVPGQSTILGKFSKCGSLHTVLAVIAHNPLHFGREFGEKLQIWQMFLRPTIK